MAETALVLTETDNGKAVTLHVGDIFSLQLYENATTGYRWTFEDSDRTVVTQLEAGYVRSSEAVGGGGHMRWLLAARAPGTAHLKLRMWRQWEGDASVRQRFAVTLVVRPK